MRNFIILFLAILTVSCVHNPSKGDLTGILNRKPWYPQQPINTVLIPKGTYHKGQSDEDIFNHLNAKPHQVSISSFYMDDAEISNNEYRQFVYWVRDSIIRATIGEDYSNVVGSTITINWDLPIDFSDQNIMDKLSTIKYAKQDHVNDNEVFDTRKFVYNTNYLDLFTAVEAQRRTKKHIPRQEFISKIRWQIYPDTLTFTRDFTYSYNDPMSQSYFYHPAYDDYPVVGVSWIQAYSFCTWRSNQFNKYLISKGFPEVAQFRLPTEAEWEYAARGGRNFSPYPWGGPYMRNSKGCFLANFKPGRGDYVTDGALYPVKAYSFFPNDYGLYNMAGNVSEWTLDVYDPLSYNLEHDKNSIYDRDIKYANTPLFCINNDSSLTSSKHTIRGGSWKDVAYMCQNHVRYYEYADTSKSYIGFRCVMSLIGE
jgi:gliding motility-associated lipoprotein GldK